MRTTTLVTVSCLWLCAVSSLVSAQGSGLIGLNQVSQAEKAPASTEEKLIRATYDKLIVYQRAAILHKLDGVAKRVTSDLVLQFELKNFRSGPIDEIKGKLHSDVVTLPAGDVVDVTHGTHTLNNGPKEAMYSASWSKGSEIPENRPDLSIGETLQLLGSQYLDVERYTSYEVTVTFEGKSRSYRALVLFHRQVGQEPKLEFWDRIGAGGVLSRVMLEELPPVTSRQAN